MNFVGLRKSKKGAALVEYGLVVGLVSVLAIASVMQLGTTTRDVFASTTAELGVIGEQVAEGAASGTAEGDVDMEEPVVSSPEDPAVPFGFSIADHTFRDEIYARTFSTTGFGQFTGVPVDGPIYVRVVPVGRVGGAMIEYTLCYLTSGGTRECAQSRHTSYYAGGFVVPQGATALALGYHFDTAQPFGTERTQAYRLDLFADASAQTLLAQDEMMVSFRP